MQPAAVERGEVETADRGISTDPGVPMPGRLSAAASLWVYPKRTIAMLVGLEDTTKLSYNGQMSLPDLPPDVTFPRLLHSAVDLEFALGAKRAAMGPHIIARWGWDEVFQRKLHEQRYSEKPFFAIQQASDRLGTISFEINLDHARLGEFYLFPEIQGKGIGTRVLRHCLALADSRNLPVRLEYLRWNPVGSLYRRQGFVEHGHSEIHYFLERPPSQL